MKACFPPNMLAGDGRAYDSGTDQLIARALNLLCDRKLSKQLPWLTAPADALGTASWWAFMSGPVWFGFEQTGTTIRRDLTVAPFFRSTGGTAKVRVTLSREKPLLEPGAQDTDGTQPEWDSNFTPVFSQTSEWSTTSTTWQTGEDKTLDLSVVDPFFGIAWLTVEISGFCQCRGLAKVKQGTRVI